MLDGTSATRPGSLRFCSSTPLGHPNDSGYTRAFITPGVELNAGKTKIYADIGLPLYTNTSGNQLVATTLFRLNVSFNL